MADAVSALRTYSMIDRLQPQLAALLGLLPGDPVVEGMASLTIEIAPGTDVYRIADAAIKHANVRLGMQVVEREFGLLELHASNLDDVRQAGQAILGILGLDERAVPRPQLVSAQVLHKVSPYQAQLVNETRKGSLLLGERSLLILECTPAAAIYVVANEVEKAAAVTLVDVRGVGAFGRLWMSGSESEVDAARVAAVACFDGN